MKLLVDTGAEVSVAPPSLAYINQNTSTSTTQYQSVSKTKRTSYGERFVTLDLGPRRVFRWIIVIDDIPTPVTGSDFLNAFDLLVHVRRQKLIDSITSLQSNAARCFSDHITPIFNASFGYPYSDILNKYPVITRQTYKEQTIKHHVYHHIETSGPPCVARFRRLTTELTT